jgi:cell wall-associated NlpC family hydrolase
MRPATVRGAAAALALACLPAPAADAHDRTRLPAGSLPAVRWDGPEAREIVHVLRRRARDEAGARAALAALSMLGTPYTWGGGAPSGPTRGIGRGRRRVGFDCSGLTLFAYARAGIALDHFTGSQLHAGRRIAYARLRPGDLLFFGRDAHHEGIAIGHGLMVHAPHTGDVVRVAVLAGAYRAELLAVVRPGT